MAKIQAYSSVSVIDYSDLGTLNFYLTSNQPNSVIYDPNNNGGTYSPNWASSNLVITPVISHNGQSLALNAQGLTITYKRKEGSGNATALTTGESVSGGVLTVSANKLPSISSGQLTYICTVTYTDPDAGVPLSAEASLTYNLVTMATQLKSVSINGESVFLYNTNSQIVGPSSITLTAVLSNCSVSQWQYKKSDGTFGAFPTTNNDSITGTSLIVKHDEANIWVNDVATIKITTNDNNTYDITQITKIRDGAPGEKTVSAVLTNENHVVAANADGTIRGENWQDGAQTQIYIYEGGSDVTSQWTISVPSANMHGITGSYNASTHIFRPTAITADNGYVDFSCTRQGYANITRRYTATKQYAGNDGDDAVVYNLIPSVYTMNVNESGTVTPSDVTFTAYKKIGAANRTNTAGRFILRVSTDGGETFTAVETTENDAMYYTYSPANNVDIIKCTFYAPGGTTTQLDEQSVVITRDGISGQNGQNGTDGLSMGLGNYSDVIPCNANGTVTAARDISIPFYAYKGITRVAVTATVGTLPSGVSVKTNTAGTTSADGLLVLTVAKDATLGNVSTGDITITLAAQSRSVAYKYCFTKNLKATDGINGVNAVILQLFSADGGYVKQGKANTTIQSILYSGTTDVTNSANFKWQQFTSGNYADITGQTASSITITDTMVTDQMWLKCVAEYPKSSGKYYNAYFVVDDLSDPLVAYSYSTIAEFKNSQGFGAIYTRVYQNGEEVDPIKSTTFSSTSPTGAKSGDYYYHLDSTAKTCTLKKYNGSSWQNISSSDNDIFTYAYYRINNQGETLDTASAWKSGRAQYIDPSIINGRMQFICEVSKP